jgi:hypothetical protein
MESRPYERGQLVKVVMISTWGDIGLTDRLDADTGYDIRVEPGQLEVVEGHPKSCENRPCRTCEAYGIRKTS